MNTATRVNAPAPVGSATHHDQRGVLLVFGSAAVWSFGGAIARFLNTSESWVIVFWRSIFAAAFLLGFMLWRDGAAGTRALFRNMGLAGLGMGACFACASTCFVVALHHTTVANILLMQAGVPLFAALICFVLFREQISRATWAAIAAVIVGVGIMVSGSFAGQISPLGDGLALLIALAFACATVITRRNAHVGMMPAVFTGVVIAACASGMMTPFYHVSAPDLGLLFLFGALNLGLGMAFFVTGARLIPSALAALVGVAEPVLGPIWVWLIHHEVPSARTLLGGAVVFAALLAHLGWQFYLQRQSANVPLAD